MNRPSRYSLRPRGGIRYDETPENRRTDSSPFVDDDAPEPATSVEANDPKAVEPPADVEITCWVQETPTPAPRSESRPVNQLRRIRNTVLGGGLLGPHELGTTADSKRDIFGGGQRQNRPDKPLHASRPRQPVARLLDFSAAVTAARQAARDRLLAAGEDPMFYPPVRYDPALMPASIASAAATFPAITASSSSSNIISSQSSRFFYPQAASFLVHSLPPLVSPQRISASWRPTSLSTSNPAGFVPSHGSGVGASAANPIVLPSAVPSAPASASTQFPLYRPTPAAVPSISTYHTNADQVIWPAMSIGIAPSSDIARSAVVLSTSIPSHQSTSSRGSIARVRPNDFGAGHSAGTQSQSYPPSSGAAATPGPAQQQSPPARPSTSGGRTSPSSDAVTSIVISTVTSTQPALCALSSGSFEDVTANTSADLVSHSGASFFSSTGLSGNLFARQREDNPSIFAHLTEPSTSFDETDFGEQTDFSFLGQARCSSFDLTALSTSAFAHPTTNSFISLASQIDPIISAGFSSLSFANQGADSSFSFANQTSSGFSNLLGLSSGAQRATLPNFANQTGSSLSSSNPLDFVSASFPNQGTYSSSTNLANQSRSSPFNPTGLPSPPFTNRGRHAPFTFADHTGFSSLNQFRRLTGALAGNPTTSGSCFTNQTSSSPPFDPTVSSRHYTSQLANNSASNPANQTQISSSTTSWIPDISSDPFAWSEAVHASLNLPNAVGYSSSAAAATQPTPSYPAGPHHLEGPAASATFPFTFRPPLPASVAGLEDPFISPPPSRNSSRRLSQQQQQQQQQQSEQYPFPRPSQPSPQQIAQPSFQSQVLSLSQQPEQQSSQYPSSPWSQEPSHDPSQFSHPSDEGTQSLTMDFNRIFQNSNPAVPGDLDPNMDILANIDPSILDPGEPDPEAMRSLEGIDPELLRALEQLPVAGQLAAGQLQNNSQLLTGELQQMETGYNGAFEFAAGVGGADLAFAGRAGRGDAAGVNFGFPASGSLNSSQEFASTAGATGTNFVYPSPAPVHVPGHDSEAETELASPATTSPTGSRPSSEPDFSPGKENSASARASPWPGASPTPSDNNDTGAGNPLPHQPRFPPAEMLNPRVNAAAVFYHAGHPAVEMYAPWSPSLCSSSSSAAATPAAAVGPAAIPRFDTDPFLPFAPWRVAMLPPFKAERIDRVLTVRGRWLAPMGLLYPGAEFAVAKWPASRGVAVRMRGIEMARAFAVLFPRAQDPSRMGQQPTSEEEEEKEKEKDKFVVSLRRRDWPIGGVAWLPDTEEAMGFVEEIKGAWDMLPGGAEVFFYVRHDVRLKGGGVGKGVWVCRAYEGTQGPQDERILLDWVRENGGLVDQDVEGREVLVRMGEAWVEPERWPKKDKKGRKGKGRARQEDMEGQ
uniref:Predicted protein n=1 Tax=Floropilus chiversii TaxID=2587399 RepID=C5H888_FLOCH|nr:predicted protein [Floropilus chiversii]